MDAIIYLRREHSKFRKNLAAIAKARNEKTKIAKFKAFCQDLTKHEKMEQNVWYPVLKKNKELRKIIAHLLSEEKSAEKAIKKFQKTGFGIMWEIRFYKLKHDVSHHANEEEQELFPKVREILAKKDLIALGTKMKKFKSSLK